MALRATVSGGSSFRKCTPCTMASVVTTISSPLRALRTAASSSRPNAPGSVASGLKWRAISESSPDILRSSPTRKLFGPELPGDLVQHRVHHAGFLAVDEGVRDIDIFRHHDAPRNILAMFELIGPGPQYRAQDRVDPLQRPALRQGLVDEGIELGLIAHHPGDDVAEESGFSRKILVAFDLAAEPMALELRENVVDPCTRDIHLVERLHRGEPCRAAP